MRVNRRVLLVTFGTRGDVQPFCVLGQYLAARGHEVRIITANAYAPLVSRFNLDLITLEDPFEEILKSRDYDSLFSNYFALEINLLYKIRDISMRTQKHISDLINLVANEIEQRDVVVYNPFAFFAGILARHAGLPAVAVMCQPLLPTRRESLSLLGGRQLGSILNRASHELPRLLTPLLWKSLRELRRRCAEERLHLLTNPITQGLRASHPLLAYSAALSPSHAAIPTRALQTGFWFKQPEAGAHLSQPLRQFLDAGSPPVYIGFGSMLWGAERNADLVMRTLQQWGGRAVISAGAGTFALFSKVAAQSIPAEQVRVVADVDHALLLPRVAAVVHHGGAGTTAAALQAGRPNIILPVLGDQLYWGRRVAAVGAGEDPLPLSRVTPTDLTGRLSRAVGNSGLRYAAAAADVAEAMSREPGVAAAASVIGQLATERGPA